MAKTGKTPRWLKGYEGRLTVKKDGRICSYANPNKTFGTEPTEAIRRFLLWEAGKSDIALPVGKAAGETPSDRLISRVAFAKANKGKATFSGELAIQAVPQAALYEWAKREIENNLSDFAKKIGKPKLTLLTDDLKPEISANLDDLISLYQADKSHLSEKEFNNSKTWWDEFCKITKAKQVKDLNHDGFRLYRETIKRNQQQGEYSTVYTRSRFGKIKSIINHALAELDLSGKDREILSRKDLLKPPPKPSVNPTDIKREELEAILKLANPQETAMILIGLNACYYPIDCSRLKWSMINLEKATLQSDRDKAKHLKGSSCVRVACLWERTIKALKAIQNETEYVFTWNNGPIHAQFANVKFCKLVERAKLSRKLTFGHLRDSGQTVAAQAGVSMQAYKILAGHSCGIDDNYVKRNPQIVKPATDAIETYYFGK